jgi:hypothetical protein
MFDLRWLMRMSHWSRRPPGMARVLQVLAVLAICLALAGLYHVGLWPDWATMSPRPHLKRP